MEWTSMVLCPQVNGAIMPEDQRGPRGQKGQSDQRGSRGPRGQSDQRGSRGPLGQSDQRGSRDPRGQSDQRGARDPRGQNDPGQNGHSESTNSDRGEQEDGTELIFGKNSVLAFLEDNELDDEEEGADSPPRGQIKKPEISKIYMSALDHPDRKVDRIKQLAKSQRIPVVICDRRKLDYLVGPNQVHQGIAAQISAAEFWELSEFLDRLRLSSPDSLNGSVIAIVDGIEDPHNLGAIIRVAESAGLKGLLLPARRSAGLTGIVAKTSAGALASLPIVRIHNLVLAIKELKEAGFWIAGLDSNHGDLYTKVDLVRPLALVIGSEGTGMGRLVKENCDMLLKIPMLGKTESLNASVAAGIVFYEVVRQLQGAGYLKP